MRVRFVTSAALAVVFSLALSGCSVQSTLASKLAPVPTTVTVEATVAAASATVDGTLDSGFPDSIPLWPGAIVTQSDATKTPQGTSYSAVLTTTDPYDNVLAGVAEGFKQADWKFEATDASTSEASASILMTSNTDAEVIVTITEAPGNLVSLQYLVTPKE